LGWRQLDIFRKFLEMFQPKHFSTGVSDTCEKFLTDVIDTGENFCERKIIFTCVNNTGEKY